MGRGRKSTKKVMTDPSVKYYRSYSKEYTKKVKAENPVCRFCLARNIATPHANHKDYHCCPPPTTCPEETSTASEKKERKPVLSIVDGRQELVFDNRRPVKTLLAGKPVIRPFTPGKKILKSALKKPATGQYQPVTVDKDTVNSIDNSGKDRIFLVSDEEARWIQSVAIERAKPRRPGRIHVVEDESSEEEEGFEEVWIDESTESEEE